MKARRGSVSLAELILVFWLFALVLAALGRFSAAQSRVAATMFERTRVNELVRTARVVLGAELRATGSSDLRGLGTDSLRVRGFRGEGVVCGGAGDTLLVGYRGGRLPEPAKDSALLLSADGVEEVAAVAGAVRSDSSCYGIGLRLRLDRAPAVSPALALVFETGVYALSGGALRYRRGAGGRQPLTETLLLDGAFAADRAGAVRVDLRLAPDSVARSPERSFAVRIPRPNLWPAHP